MTIFGESAGAMSAQLVTASVLLMQFSGGHWGGMSFQPAVDGELVTDFPYRALAAVRAPKPVVIGFNASEFRLFEPARSLGLGRPPLGTRAAAAAARSRSSSAPPPAATG